MKNKDPSSFEGGSYYVIALHGFITIILPSYCRPVAIHSFITLHRRQAAACLFLLTTAPAIHIISI